MRIHRHSVAPLPGDVGAAWERVAAFASAMEAGLDRWLTESYRVGLTEFRALIFVGRAADKELRVNTLAQRVGLNQSSATRLVSRLEAKGLVRREVCGDDGRGVYAVLTERGESVIREARRPYEDRIGEMLGDLPSHSRYTETGQLVGALEQVRDLIAS